MSSAAARTASPSATAARFVVRAVRPRETGFPAAAASSATSPYLCDCARREGGHSHLTSAVACKGNTLNSGIGNTIVHGYGDTIHLRYVERLVIREGTDIYGARHRLCRCAT